VERGGTSIALLGPPRIERGGEFVAFDTRKAVALVAVLAARRRPQRRDVLAALLWPEADEAHARSALRRTLSVLKQGLGDACLVVRRDELALVDGPEVEIDLRRFDDDVAAGGRDGLASAVARYRGPFLEGFALRDAAVFEDWQRVEAERVQRDYAVALRRLADLLAADGALDEAMGHAQRWLALDPLHEPAHQAVMRLQALLGDRPAAVRQYRMCVRTLEEELGVAPLDETTALYEAIAAGDVPALPPVAIPPPRLRPLVPPRAAPRYRLVGRATELAALASVAEQGGLAIVDGEAGIGKTRLLDEVGARLRADGRTVLSARCYQGEADLPYAPIVELLRAAAADPDATARVVDTGDAAVEAARLVPGFAGASPPPRALDDPGAEARFVDGVSAALVAAAGGSRSGVLILDDVHWADRDTQRILAFVVRRLGTHGPSVVLSGRSVDLPDVVGLTPALAVRRQRGDLERVRLGRLTACDVAELVEGAGLDPDLAAQAYDETEGLPALAVAWLDAAAEGRADVDASDLLRSRLDGLSAQAIQLLGTAAVIGRSFAFDVVLAASGRSEEEAVAALEELVARGVVDERDVAGSPAYDFTHDRLRTLVYGDTSLARRRLLHHRVAEALLVHARHGDPAVGAAAVAYHERLAGRDGAAAEHFKRAGDHARAVYANADALAHYESALALGYPEPADLHEAIGDLQTRGGRFGDAATSYERAAAWCAPGAVARLEGKLGDLYQRRGAWAAAEQHYEAAAEALAGDGNDAALARVVADRAMTAHRRGDAAGAAALAGKAVALAERCGDERALAHAGTVAGVLATARGDLDTAFQLLERSHALAGKHEDLVAGVASANALARAHRAGGQLDHAEQLLLAALATCTAMGDRHREAALHDALAGLLHALDRGDEAMAHLKQAVAIFADIGTEEGAVQTEVWKLAEWVDQTPAIVTAGSHDPAP
jgi:DNA-binding SARP family transcriptional activator